MKVKVVNKSNNALPAYETKNSAGMDLRAYLPEGPVTLQPMQRALIPTGLYLEIPEGYEGQVRPRSGLAIKYGITVLNTPGTIDADYRGELKQILINLSDQPFVINNGDRIAQIIFARCEQAEMVEVEELSETERGAGGFGHTGRIENSELRIKNVETSIYRVSKNAELRIMNKGRYFGLLFWVLAFAPTFAQEAGENPEGPIVIDKRKNATFFSDGLQCKYREDVQGAIKNFEQALQYMPNDAASMYELSEQYTNAGRMNDAFLMIRKAVELEPGNKWYKLRLGKFYRNMEQYDSFIKLYEDLTAQYPDDLDMLTELIDALLVTEDYDKALDKMDLLEKQIGNNELITEQRLKIYARLGNSKQVISELKKQIEKNPANTRYYNMLAQVYMNLGKEKDALATFKKVKEIDPNDPYINVALLEFYDNKGDTDKAFAELLEAIRNNSLDLNTKVSIYEYWFKKAGESDKVDEQAHQCGEAFVEMYPEDKVGYLVLGAYYMSKNQFPNAKTVYLQSLSVDSTDYVSWQNLVFAEADMEDHEAVRQHAIKALQYYPMQPIFYWYAGVGCALAKENDDAIAYLEKGRRFISDNSLMVSFDSYLGDLYHEAGDEQKAFDAYDRVLANDPDNVLVLNNYAYYLSLKNEDLDKALRMSARAVELEPDNATYLDTYAWVLYMKGNFVEAEKQMKKAIKLLKTPDALYYEHYAEILQKLGRMKESLEYQVKAKQLSE